MVALLSIDYDLFRCHNWHMNKITAKMIAKGYTFEEGLREIGKSRRTYYRWLSHPQKKMFIELLVNNLKEKVDKNA